MLINSFPTTSIPPVSHLDLIGPVYHDLVFDGLGQEWEVNRVASAVDYPVSLYTTAVHKVDQVAFYVLDTR